MNEMISGGFYAPLDDLLAQYGANIVGARSEKMIEANKFNGKVYGLPQGNVQGGNNRQYIIRKDLREKYGIGPIKTLDELKEFAYAVGKNDPSVIPWGTQTGNSSYVPFVLSEEYDPYFRSTGALGQSLVLYFNANDGKVHNLFDEMEPKIWARILEARQLYQDKIIHQDVLAVKDMSAEMKSGKIAILVANDFGVPDALLAVQDNVAGAELESVNFFDQKAQITDFKQNNFIALSESSSHKEAAIQFLDWAASSQENYDLLAYGIEGVNWEAVGDKQYKSIGSGYAWFPFMWNWDPTHDRMNANFSQDVLDIYKQEQDPANFTEDILTGFSFDASPVTNELAQYNQIEQKYYAGIMNGVMDPDGTWATFKKEGAALAKKIQNEYQKQVDAFLAAKP
ncbi:extracellular solute-binding protein [Cohnella sp. GCM10020058]|uniref:extracellular solute-binding protein n=1 Tax=Cohnella sp. GCM10020058 TaxID=3317330 RepID=UPI0036415DBA